MHLKIMEKKIIEPMKDLLTKFLKIVDSNLATRKQSLISLINSKFNEASSLVFTHTKDEIFEQNGIKYLLKVRQSHDIDNKPISIKMKLDNNSDKTVVDVFHSDFITNDLLIDDNFDQFRLLFNKYPILKNHIILVTKEFESQNTHLNLAQISNSLYLNSLLDSICFFNGGYNAGASQMRKHLQFIPKESFSNLSFGIFNLITKQNDILIKDDENELCSYYTIKDLKLSHYLLIFKQSLSNVNNENQDEIAKIIFSLYYDCLNKLKLLKKEYKNLPVEDIYSSFKSIFIDESKEILEDKNYSLIITDEFMFITYRKEHKLSRYFVDDDIAVDFNINSIGFLFTILLKSEKQREYTKKMNILDDVFNKL